MMTMRTTESTRGTLVLLGQACIVSAAGAVHRLERKDAGLLALLALQGRTPRSRVAALLWPDVDDERARTNLRQRLSRLRRVFDDLVVDHAGVLSLRDDIEVDARAPAGAAVDGAADLLGTFEYDDCAEFAQWLETRRDLLRRVRLDALTAQVQCLRETDPDHALRTAQALLQLEPESEVAYRLLIDLYYLRGDLTSALAAFAACEQMMKRVFGTAPSAQTLDVAKQAHTAQQDRRRIPALASLPAALLRPPRMVGRDRVLALACDALNRRRTLVIAGDAGIGKSRLIEEVLARCGTRAVRFRCRPDDALQPRHALARCLIEVAAVSQPTLDTDTRRELARLVPAFGPPPEPMTSTVEVEAFHTAVVGFLDACQADCGALVIAFDDLQFADPASVDALKVCVRPQAAAAGAAPAFVLATRLQGGSWQARDLVKTLESAPAAEALVLGPLTSAATRELVGDLDLGDARWSRMADQLHAHCDGNPALLLEALKALVSGTPTQTAADGLPLSATMQQSLQQRLTGLTPVAADLAQLAAVAGEAFSPHFAARALGQPPIALSPALRELHAAQIFRDGMYAHDLQREAMYDTLPVARRDALHLAVAEVLQADGAAPTLIAHHLLAGRDPVSALPHLHRAQHLAQQAQRPDECARLYEEIANIELARGERAAGVSALANAFSMYMSTSFIEDANRIFDRWSQWASTPAERLGLHAHRAMQQSSFKYIDEARRHADRAIETMDSQHDLPADLVAECFEAVVSALVRIGRSRDAAALAQRTAHRVDGASPSAALSFHAGSASAFNGIGRYAQAIDAISRAVALHEAGVAPIQEWNNRSRRCNYLTHAGRLREAADEGQRSIEAGRRQPHFPTLTSTAHFTRAMALAALGEYREALTCINARRDYFRRTGWRSDLREAGRLALLHLHLGTPRLAAEDLHDLDLTRGTAEDLALVDLVRAQIALALGRPARPHVEAALARADSYPLAEPLLRARLVGAAELAPAQALDVALAALDEARREQWPTLIRSAAICGALAAAELRADCAPELAELTLSQAEACDAIIGYMPQAQWAAYRALQAAGQIEQSRAALSAGVDWVRRTARTQVPPEFSNSFLHGNAVNRALLKTAQMIGDGARAT